MVAEDRSLQPHSLFVNVYNSLGHRSKVLYIHLNFKAIINHLYSKNDFEWSSVNNYIGRIVFRNYGKL